VGELRFAIATFKRVFDVTPSRDVLSLEELARGLTRFAVRPKLQARVDRELARLERAWRALLDGEARGGRHASVLRRAYARAGRAGAEQAYEKMRRRAKARSKTELRIWSPTLYPPGARRGADHVVHLSCVVLDYDEGASIDEASDRWSEVFHIVHSTWSYTPERPRFRLVLPLAHPVPAEHWEPVWSWASARAGGCNDPALKSPASTYALPATPSVRTPRRAFVVERPLLDPLAIGLVPRVAPPPAAVPSPAPVSQFRGDPDLQFVDAGEADVALADFELFGGDDEDPLEEEFDLFGADNEDSLDEFDLF